MTCILTLLREVLGSNLVYNNITWREKKILKKKKLDRSSRTIQCYTKPCNSYLHARCKKGEKDKPRQYMHITCGMYCLVDCVVCVASGEIQM